MPAINILGNYISIKISMNAAFIILYQLRDLHEMFIFLKKLVRL